MAEKRIKLGYPISVNNKICDEIALGRFKVKHLKLLPKDFVSKSKKGDIDPSVLCPLIAGLTGLKESEVDEIDVDDLFKIVDELEDFLGSTPDSNGEQ